MAGTPAVLIVNPRAGGGRFIEHGSPAAPLRQITGDLESGGFELETAITSSSEEATSVARDAVERERQVAFALGGDGTFRDVAQSLVGSSVAIGLLGGGTTNVLPYSLGLPRRAEDMARALSSGGFHHSRIDVGLCRTGDQQEHLFLMMVSRGLDARALARTPAARKRRFGRLGIGATALIEWLRAEEPPFLLDVAGSSLRTSFASIHNIEHYGGTLRMAPGARPDDGLLSVIALSRQGRGALASFGLGLLAGRHLRSPGVSQLAAASAAFPGQGRVTIQIDGDPLTVELPMTLSLQDRALLVLVPGPASGAPPA